MGGWIGPHGGAMVLIAFALFLALVVTVFWMAVVA